MKKILLTTLFIFFILPVEAIEENSKISLEDAINVALSTNPQIKIAKLEIQQAQNNIKSANSFNNPSFGTFQNIGKTANGNPQQVGVDYVIEILKRSKRKNIAKSELSSTQFNQKLQEQKLILDVKLAYFDFLLKKSNLKIIKEQEKISEEIYNHTQNSFKNKKVPKTDVVQAKIEYNRAIMYSNIAKSEVISAQNRFNTVMNSNQTNYDTKEDTLNNNYETLLTINPNQLFYDFQKVKDFAIKNRYDLKCGLKEVEIAENKLKEIKSKRIPDLEIQGGYAYLTSSNSDSGNFRQGAYAGINLVNIPLINNYSPEIKNAKLEIEKSQLKYEDNKIDAIRNITDAWEKYEISRNTLNFYNKELLLNSKELLNESIKNLNNKKIDLTNFYIYKKLHLELMLGYQEALSEYYISFAELLKELNIKDYKELL